jgi:hypothetical protein
MPFITSSLSLNYFDVETVIVVPEPEGRVIVTEDNPAGYNYGFDVGRSGTGKIGDGFYGGAGINLTYIGSGALSYSVSISGLINNHVNYYNDAFHDSLSMKSYSFIITYDTNFSH